MSYNTEPSEPTSEAAPKTLQRYPAHPAATIFPLLDSEGARELAEDIREHGLREEIVLLDGSVLDGRNRLTACLAAGIEPRFREFDPATDGEDPVEFVISRNLRRRHLTPSQAATAAVGILPLLKAKAKERQREGGRHKEVIQNSAKASAAPRHMLPAEARERGSAHAQAGRHFGVSKETVRVAEKLKEEDPPAFEQVMAGARTLNNAVTGTPTPHTPAASKIAQAWAAIERGVSKEQAATLREAGLRGDLRNALKLAMQPDWFMRAVANLVAAGWPLGEALKYRGSEDEDDDPFGWNLNSLVMHIVARGKNDYEGVFYPHELPDEEWIVAVRPKNPPPKTK